MDSTVPATAVAFTVGATTVVAIMDAAASMGVALADADLADGRASQVVDLASVDVAAQSAADRLAVASEAALVSTGAVGSTAAPADSTAVVGRMVVVEATAA